MYRRFQSRELNTCRKLRHKVAAIFENRDFCDSTLKFQYGLLVMWKWLKSMAK